MYLLYLFEGGRALLIYFCRIIYIMYYILITKPSYAGKTPGGHKLVTAS